MIEATSCGGVVIYRGKILALYKSYKNRYEAGCCRKEPWSRAKHISRLLYERCVKKQESKLP